MSPVLGFGDDRSDGSDRCWEWIASHHWEGWRLEIVTAEPPADMRPVEDDEAGLHPWEPERPRESSATGFTEVAYLRAAIDPRLALIARPWDLLAVGARGSGLLKTLHLGSTADWLLREPTSPLVIARQPGPVDRALVAADGSAHSQRAVSALASVPWVSGLRARVITVDDGRIDPTAAMKSVSDTLAAVGARVEAVTRMGDATREILAEMESWEPDLVVMGTRGHVGIRRVIVGSTTAAVTGSTECSILAAHTVEAASTGR